MGVLFGEIRGDCKWPVGRNRRIKPFCNISLASGPKTKHPHLENSPLDGSRNPQRMARNPHYTRTSFVTLLALAA
ncbi:hypothetical protein [Bifidobacterium leontopitheci]|uniref:hypothetical protein n=1 Tax=Bifidobacterium leontopitheci TaxID=2650774 RepID=UPI001265A2E6|nr:hypothetical protein [Bifidobacterium leontopitheci]